MTRRERPRAPESSGPESGGMRMAELAARSGVSRETIHFYLREGLLPRPRKGGRTVAYYDAEHLERLRLIRRLREEKYLPLAVIRRIIDTPGAPAEGDLDALAEVLHIVPAPALESKGGGIPPEAAVAEAGARGLLGRHRGVASETAPHTEALDASERRVLSVIVDVLALASRAKELTLVDLEACAAQLTELVEHEAALFFDAVFTSGDVPASIAALRAGRGAVARFVTAYRDLMLRRIVEEVLLAIQRGPEVVARVRTVPLSDELERALGTFARRDELVAELERDPTSPALAAAWIWDAFERGAAAELAAAPRAWIERAGAKPAVLAAWGAHEVDRSAASLRALQRAAGEVDFALGQVLAGEAELVRHVRRRESNEGILEVAVPALHRIIAADPDRDSEPAARAFGYFHRGRVEIALPPVLGRRLRGAAGLGRALAIVLDDAVADRIAPSARARIATNARFLLGLYHADLGDDARSLALLEEARAADPKGPIADALRERLRSTEPKP